MPNWLLCCPHCNARFVHSEVTAPATYDPFYLSPKPEFPDGGINLTCPHCTKESCYERHDLVYSSVH